MKQKDYRIREAVIKDFPSIMALFKMNSDTFSRNEIPAAQKYIEELIKGMIGRFFVSVSKNKIVGCAGYSKEADTDGVYSFNWLAVHPDFKRHGMATELYNMIENKIKAFGGRLIIVNAGSNEVNRFFYKKMGFKACGRIPQYHSEKKDLIWYYKKVSKNKNLLKHFTIV